MGREARVVPFGSIPCMLWLLDRRPYVCNLLDDRVYVVWMRGDNAAAKELWQQGGAEALRGSLDETYHPDEVSGHSSTLSCSMNAD